MITHDEAKGLLGYKNPFATNRLREYIAQQEQLEKTLNSIKEICNKPSETMILSLAEISKRYIEIDNLVNTFEGDE